MEESGLLCLSDKYWITGRGMHMGKMWNVIYFFWSVIFRFSVFLFIVLLFDVVQYFLVFAIVLCLLLLFACKKKRREDEYKRMAVYVCSRLGILA